MSRKVLNRDSKTKQFSPRARDSKKPSQGPVTTVDKGIVSNVALPAPGPVVLSQHPAATTPLGNPVIKR